MKKKKLLSILLVAGMVCVQPLSAMAADLPAEQSIVSEDSETTAEDALDQNTSQDDASSESDTISEEDISLDNSTDSNENILSSTPSSEDDAISEDDSAATEDNASPEEDSSIEEGDNSQDDAISNADSSIEDDTASEDDDTSVDVEEEAEPSGTWEVTGGQRKYKLDDGTYLADGWHYIDGLWYCFDKDGYQQVGWQKQEETWTDEDGNEYPYTDWYYYNSDGSMATGWQFIGGSWYYLAPDYGCMYSNGIQGIEENEGEWTLYAFDKNGAMITGWYKQTWSDNSYDWYYFDSNGAGHDGWLFDNGKWYYCDDGWMFNDGIYGIGDDDSAPIYAFDKSGAMITGWYADTWNDYDEEGNITTYTNWFYFDSNGAGHNGWLLDGGKWYYLDPDYGYMYSDGLRDIKESDGSWTTYAFAKSGAMITGWYQETWLNDETGESGSDWFYFDSNGTPHNGWLLDGGKWYYCENGWMWHDCFEEINGKTYRFTSSGAIAIGWYQETWLDEETGESGSDWFYFDNSGAMATGWQLIGGTWYYLDPDVGFMYSDGIFGIEESDGSWTAYAFTKDGAMVTGWYAISGISEKDEIIAYTDWFYFDSNGAGHNGWLFYGGKWYYCEDSWMYCDDIFEIDGTLHSFDANGIWLGEYTED